MPPERSIVHVDLRADGTIAPCGVPSGQHTILAVHRPKVHTSEAPWTDYRRDGRQPRADRIGAVLWLSALGFDVAVDSPPSPSTPSAWQARADLTPEVPATAGIAGVSVQDWSRRGVLPPYETFHGDQRGKTSWWPLHAPAQAKWVKALLDEGHTFEEIRAKLAGGEFSSSPEGHG